MLKTILWIVGIIVGGGLLLGLMKALFNAFSWLKWILCIAAGVGSYFAWHHWWLSLIVAFFALGLGGYLSETTDRSGKALRCKECGSGNIDIIQDDEEALIYKCKNCGSMAYRMRR
ncbi:MAG TPA: hypothetical protein DIW30_05615 [Bacteroidales bacterium]|nr:hypothetical protein [Bacteroidales bacterium]